MSAAAAPGLCWELGLCWALPLGLLMILLFSRSDLKLRVRILIDGTLIIFRVKPEDAGKYTCIPSNSLGRSPSASAYLTVQCECRDGAGIDNTWLRGSPRGSGVLV